MTVYDGIGGYLELEKFTGEPYHRGIALDSARSCLKYEIRLREIKAIWLPDYMCSAVREACEDEHVSIHTYAIGEDFLPVYDFSIGPNEWLYLADFFGQLHSKDVSISLEYSRGNLIVDEVQGFFRKPWPEADTIYTCRKFFGVADGAYLCTRDTSCLDIKFSRDRSTQRMGQILGRLEDGSASWFSASQKNEEHFEHAPILSMSKVTERLLRAVDYNMVGSIREHNWDVLSTELEESNLLQVNKPRAPYMYPYLIENADSVRKIMASRGIFIPTLWPNVLTECNKESAAYRYAQNLLPLPIDQRYGSNDMHTIIESLKSVLGD